MSDQPGATEELPPPQTDQEKLEEIYGDIEKCIMVTAAKSDVDRLLVVLAKLRAVVYPEVVAEAVPDPVSEGGA